MYPMQDEKDESIDWVASLLQDQIRFQQLAIETQIALKVTIGNALPGVSSSAFAATRSLVQLQKGARFENEVWSHRGKLADGYETGTYEMVPDGSWNGFILCSHYLLLCPRD